MLVWETRKRQDLHQEAWPCLSINGTFGAGIAILLLARRANEAQIRPLSGSKLARSVYKPARLWQALRSSRSRVGLTKPNFLFLGQAAAGYLDHGDDLIGKQIEIVLEMARQPAKRGHDADFAATHFLEDDTRTQCRFSVGQRKQE
jgi:hypothetical protein